MHNQWALMALATVVVLVLAVSELLPFMVGTKDTLDKYNFGRAKQREKQRGGY